MSGAADRVALALLAVPLGASAVLAAVQPGVAGPVVGGLCVLALAALLAGWRGAILAGALALCLGLLWTVVLAAALNALIPSCAAGFVGASVFAWAATRAGIARSRRWMRARADRGAPLLGWEWVQAGPGFALAHPLAQRLGAVWALVGWTLAVATVALAAAVLSARGVDWALALLWAALALGTVPALLRRHPAAYPMGWLVIVLTFPVSLPLALYWADGARPNLIYRWRFERLVPLEARA